MEILDCVIDTNSAIYIVKTTGGNVFHHTLSTDTLKSNRNSNSFIRSY